MHVCVYIYIYMTESLCYTPETNTTLLNNQNKMTKWRSWKFCSGDKDRQRTISAGFSNAVVSAAKAGIEDRRRGDRSEKWELCAGREHQWSSHGTRREGSACGSTQLRTKYSSWVFHWSQLSSPTSPSCPSDMHSTPAIPNHFPLSKVNTLFDHTILLTWNAQPSISAWQMQHFYVPHLLLHGS